MDRSMYGVLQWGDDNAHCAIGELTTLAVAEDNARFLADGGRTAYVVKVSPVALYKPLHGGGGTQEYSCPAE